MKIAIIGAGISGLTSAYYLQPKHEVVVFEANAYIGGHTNTHDVELHGERYAVDSGFIVFNDRTYPNFCKLLDELGVEAQNTPMSFSVSCEESGLEYRGADLNGLFAQRRNVFNLKYLKLLRDLLKFNKNSDPILEDKNEEQTVGEFFAKHQYSKYFVDKYFLPMASAIWSCPHETILDFPIRFIVEFYRNHGLLSVNDRPQWKVIKGGSKQYVPHLTKSFRDSIRLNTPVQAIKRTEDAGVEITTEQGVEKFDHVVFACHSDQALAILADGATATEREILSKFPYEENIAVLHTDETVLPRCRRAWACWNYHIHKEDSSKATVTYNMNILQGIESPETFSVTLNCPERVNPGKVLRRIQYHHPVFSAGRSVFQKRQSEINGPNRTSFCGAYWGNGFHEDGVASALVVTDYLNQSQIEESCIAASTRGG
jgi:predicted NAD/FAD-binding protein